MEHVLDIIEDIFVDVRKDSLVNRVRLVRKRWNENEENMSSIRFDDANNGLEM